ncbi:MAG: M48 family metalloprotease [Defluviitaleaceae bacterium]|nr:M48 family metalloprotease [Defluviitaleaceae bacterium]
MEKIKWLLEAIGRFLASNYLYIAWFFVYFMLAWGLLGGGEAGFMLVLVVYSVSITIALSPIGEILLRLLENCREPQTEVERDYLLPLFEEAYESAKELVPSINQGIKIYIMDAMYVNAFAIGRRTIAVTRGALETFTEDELKGILAHELGHMNYGHTKALLLSLIGNLFFSVIIWFFRLVLNILQIATNIFAHISVIALGFAFFTFIIRIIVEASTFVFVNLSQIILALNSRTNETQADKFAHDIGYGKELISSMYLLQKISMNKKMRLADRAKASHPHLAYRISKLEKLEREAVTG